MKTLVILLQGVFQRVHDLLIEDKVIHPSQVIRYVCMYAAKVLQYC